MWRERRSLLSSRFVNAQKWKIWDCPMSPFRSHTHSLSSLETCKLSLTAFRLIWSVRAVVFPVAVFSLDRQNHSGLEAWTEKDIPWECTLRCCTCTGRWCSAKSIVFRFLNNAKSEESRIYTVTNHSLVSVRPSEDDFSTVRALALFQSGLLALNYSDAGSRPPRILFRRTVLVEFHFRRDRRPNSTTRTFQILASDTAWGRPAELRASPFPTLPFRRSSYASPSTPWPWFMASTVCSVPAKTMSGAWVTTECSAHFHL